MRRVRHNDSIVMQAYLFVNNNVNLDALLCFAFQQTIEAPFGMIRRWATKIQLRGEPPVLRT